MEPLLHSRTSQNIKDYLSQPAHGLILEGLTGIGKGTVARYIAARALNVPINKLNSYPFFSTLVAENGSLTIDQVRQVQHFMRLKTIGDNPIRRVLIIEQAELLTIEAQNALLKTLEEPPADSVLILTTAQPQQLLPTVRSRARVLSVQAPNRDDLLAYFKKENYSQSAIDKAYQLSEGRVGLMHAILADDQEHPLLKNIEIVKELLAKPTFDRLAMIDTIVKQVPDLDEFLQAWQLVCSGALHQAARTGKTASVKKWHSMLKHSNWAETQYKAHPNAKLLLSDLMLSLA